MGAAGRVCGAVATAAVLCDARISTASDLSDAIGVGLCARAMPNPTMTIVNVIVTRATRLTFVNCPFVLDLNMNTPSVTCRDRPCGRGARTAASLELCGQLRLAVHVRKRPSKSSYF